MGTVLVCLKRLEVINPDNKIGQNSGKSFGKYSHHIVVKGVRANNKIIRKLQIDRFTNRKQKSESSLSTEDKMSTSGFLYSN